MLMAHRDLRLDIKSQLTHLESLLAYLEDRERLGAKEYLFCQARLQAVIKELKHVERIVEEGSK